jgi:AcrR family transcriptional regulator
MVTTATRAKPMSPEDRKSAILSVVIPLIAAKGASVTTAEIADAANVAEGTIYRVFPDKVTLLIEAVKAAIDPSEIEHHIDSIDPSLPLTTKLIHASDLLSTRIKEVTALVNAVRSVPHSAEKQHDSAHKFIAESEATITASLARMLEPHAGELTVEPVKAAMALRGLLLASAHPLLAQADSLSTVDIVSILTSGIVTTETD